MEGVAGLADRCSSVTLKIDCNIIASSGGLLPCDCGSAHEQAWAGVLDGVQLCCEGFWLSLLC